MSRLSDVAGTIDGAERERRRKSMIPVVYTLGHAVKNRMTVIF